MERADRDKLTVEHIDLADKIAAGMIRRFGAVIDPEEIRSMAMEGLVQAVDRYDHSRGSSFGAYATARIRGAIYDGMVDASWFPRRMIRKIAYYRRADEMMSQASKAPPPLDTVETAHRLAGNLRELAAAYVTTWAAEQETSREEEVEEEEDAELWLSRQEYRERVLQEVGTLPDKQRQVVELYFWKDLDMPEIARLIDRHKSSVHRILNDGLRRLRKRFDRSGEELGLDIDCG
ncbi:MAG: sigma-70 family RNA polymerase sigma factor [Polyangia bacterium]